MSHEPISVTMRSLLKAARTDVPSAAARAKVWSGVSAAAGGAAGTAAATTTTTTTTLSGGAAGLTASKMLALGTLFGGAVTVGVTTFLLYASPSLKPTPAQPVPVAVAQAGRSGGAMTLRASKQAGVQGAESNTGESPIAASLLSGPAAESVTESPRSGAKARAAGPAHGAPHPSHPVHPGNSRVQEQANGDDAEDALTREVSRVADARAALARGDAETALRLARSAHSMPLPQLGPEELAVEAQALRLLGREDEAQAVAARLRSEYPDSALAR